ncbi:MAG: hypothetical protein JXK05_14285 [Campylobacterales bacterium]|nr:hypothetical protein [Campylobacterales bacterium]
MSLRPLYAHEVESFEARFDYAIGGVLRRIEIKNPETISLHVSVQDKRRDFDWIDLEIEISSVSDTRLVEDKQLRYLDMEEGITVMFEEKKALIAVGEYDTIESALSAPLYILGGALKYQENTFSA